MLLYIWQIFSTITITQLPIFNQSVLRAKTFQPLAKPWSFQVLFFFLIFFPLFTWATEFCETITYVYTIPYYSDPKSSVQGNIRHIQKGRHRNICGVQWKYFFLWKLLSIDQAHFHLTMFLTSCYPYFIQFSLNLELGIHHIWITPNITHTYITSMWMNDYKA